MAARLMKNESKPLHAVVDDAFDPPKNYNDVFPELANNVETTQSADSLRLQPKKRVFRTEVFQIMPEDRVHRTTSSGNSIKVVSGGDKTLQQRNICTEIARLYGVSIELNSTKDDCLKVFISGDESDVKEAKRQLSMKLQKRHSVEMHIPLQHHQTLIGLKGAKLQQIELMTCTSISFGWREKSDVVRILGPRDGVLEAQELLQARSDELLKLDVRRLSIPKKFHLLLMRSVKSEPSIKMLLDDKMVRLNMPLLNVDRDYVHISGDREAVHIVCDFIDKQYKLLQSECMEMSIQIDKEKHKYVKGAYSKTILDIFEATGVYVRLPLQNSTDRTVFLFGLKEQLGKALTMIIAAAESIKIVTIPAKDWLHKYVIGEGRRKLVQLTEGYEKTQLIFRNDEIRLEGPTDEVGKLSATMEELVADLKRQLTFAELSLDASLQDDAVKKLQSNLSRIKRDNGVRANLLLFNNKRFIRIEGSEEAVKKASSDIEAVIAKIQNTEVREIEVDQQLAVKLIGKIIAKVKASFPSVTVQFPSVDDKMDVLRISGPRQQIDCATEAVNEIYNKLKVTYDDSIEIPVYLHNRVIGRRGSNILEIGRELNNEVTIRFPGSASNSSTVYLTGRKPAVLAAKDRLRCLVEKLNEKFYQQVMVYPHRNHIYLMGPDRQHVKEIQQKTKTTILFPESSDKNVDEIVVTGSKDNVEKAIDLLEAFRDKLDEIVEKVIVVNIKHRTFFLSDRYSSRYGVRLEIKPENMDNALCGGDEVSEADVSQQNVLSLETFSVYVSGPKQIVNEEYEAIRRDLNILEHGTEYELLVDSGTQSFLGKHKDAIDAIQCEFQAIISIGKSLIMHSEVSQGAVEIYTIVSESMKWSAERAINASNSDFVNNSDQDTGECAKFLLQSHLAANCANGSSDFDTQLVTNGFYSLIVIAKSNSIEEIKRRLFAVFPVEIKMPLESQLFSLIIGKGGRGIRKMYDEFSVVVTLPISKEPHIKLLGTKANVCKAMDYVEDIITRNYVLSVSVEPKFHGCIIGTRGANLARLNTTYGVQVIIPDSLLQDDNVKIIGYREKTEAARDDILQLVERLNAYVTAYVNVSPRLHSTLIGFKGRMLADIRKRFNVDVNVPVRDSIGEAASTVSVTGEPEQVDSCCKHIIKLVNNRLSVDGAYDRCHVRKHKGKDANDDLAEERNVSCCKEITSASPGLFNGDDSDSGITVATVKEEAAATLFKE